MNLDAYLDDEERKSQEPLPKEPTARDRMRESQKPYVAIGKPFTVTEDGASLTNGFIFGVSLSRPL